MEQKEWFASWFDTDYYHILYRHRDKNEAKQFIENLCLKLEIPKGAAVLDLACGMGRHSVTLFNLGYNVTGADLSENSIQMAKTNSPEGIDFFVHDMRYPIEGKNFDAVFNLFTSFGYFDNASENEEVLRSIHSMLNPEGLLIIDFLNARKVVKEIEPETIIRRDGIEFHITKRYDGNHIFKEIKFEDKGRNHDFEERVQALTLDDFKSLLGATGFNILSTFGDLDLGNFDEQSSDRLILIAKKG